MSSPNPRSQMGCGGSISPDATDPSASEVDPTADAPPVSRNPGVTSASEVTVSVSTPAPRPPAAPPRRSGPRRGRRGGGLVQQGELGALQRSLDERVAAHEAALQGRGSQGSRPGSRMRLISAGTRRVTAPTSLAEPDAGARAAEDHASSASRSTRRAARRSRRASTRSTPPRRRRRLVQECRAAAPATVPQAAPGGQGGARRAARSRRRSLGTLVSKKTEVEATEGEMVRKGKKARRRPRPSSTPSSGNDRARRPLPSVCVRDEMGSPSHLCIEYELLNLPTRPARASTAAPAGRGSPAAAPRGPARRATPSPCRGSAAPGGRRREGSGGR